MKRTTRTYLAALSLTFAPMAANAVPITLIFEAEDFISRFGAHPAAPTDPVTGTIVYEAADLLSPIDALTSISLEIDEYSYALGEVSFINQPFNNAFRVIIGGLSLGVGAIGSGTNDFFLVFSPDEVSNPAVFFNYGTESIVDDLWASTSVSISRTEGVVPVPEPGTLALLGLGLAATGLGRRRMRGRV